MRFVPYHVSLISSCNISISISLWYGIEVILATRSFFILITCLLSWVQRLIIWREIYWIKSQKNIRIWYNDGHIVKVCLYVIDIGTTSPQTAFCVPASVYVHLDLNSLESGGGPVSGDLRQFCHPYLSFTLIMGIPLISIYVYLGAVSWKHLFGQQHFLLNTIPFLWLILGLFSVCKQDKKG